MNIGRLHVVTDDEILARPDFAAVLESVLRAGGSGLTIHLRGHATAGGALFALADRSSAVARDVGARVVVNDRVDVALAAGAAGVQLGRHGLPIPRVRSLVGARLIGYSAHAADEAARAAVDGADFVLIGTIYETDAHPGPAAGLALVRACAVATPAPLVPIGGVTPERVRTLLGAGAAAVAVRGAVWNAPDPASAAAGFMEALGSD